MSVAKTFILIFNQKMEAAAFRMELNSLHSDILNFEFLNDAPIKNEFGQWTEMLRMNISEKTFYLDVHYFDIDQMNCIKCIELITFDHDIFETLTDNGDSNLKKVFTAFETLSSLTLIAFYVEGDTPILPEEIISKFESDQIEETHPYELKFFK
jgi:hypothetical protein